MKKTTFSRFCAGLSLLYFINNTVHAQPTVAPNMATPVKANMLDAAAFTQWENGVEKPVADKQVPSWVVWTDTGATGFSGVSFGDSKTPGARHLRIGFKSPVPMGTVLVRGGGTLSILKPDAAYPGDLSDESQWIPAERLFKGEISQAEAGRESYVLWTLPPSTRTRALRFTHTAKAADNSYAGWLGGVFLMNERLINIAPHAQASASSTNQFAARINNNSNDGTWGIWANVGGNEALKADVPVISAENPEWVMLTWATPVKLSGLQALWAGFGAAEVQVYNGPADHHPRDASEADWQSIKSFKGLKNGYPVQLWPNRLDFGQVVTTRALRLRITGPTQEEHTHTIGTTKKGKRVWLGELMALQPLDNSPLKPVKFENNTAVSHPPIPVRFNLKQAGYVTLVIEDASGKRVRNLVSETYFPAGDNIAWWDGTNDLGRDLDAARHGLYKIPARFVEPAQYRVRGLVRDAVDLRYEFSVYMEGTPPWTTPDTSGGWLTNHTPSQAALFVPAEKAPKGQPLVFLGSLVSEGGAGLAWVDLDGRKQGGRGWIGGNWTSAPFLAGDSGAQALKDIYAYVGAVGESGKPEMNGELRITGLTTKGDKPILKHRFKGRTGNVAAEISGLAARDGIVVVSMSRQKQLLFADAKAGKVIGTAPIESTRGMAFDAKGALLVLTSTQLLRFDSIQLPLAEPKIVITSGLESPNSLALDATGNIYISDRGQSHQVKVFDANGKFLRTIGKAGVPKAGQYDQLRMNNPAGLAIDSKNQLWVTENDYLPKRVSVWTLDGKFIKAFYGPGKYGGGGTIDANDKTRFYYADEARGVLEFKLDWKTGTSQLTNVLYRPEKEDLKLPERSSAPETAFYRDGKRYFTNCYNANPTSGAGTAFLFLEKNGLIHPIAAMGRANDWDVLKGDDFKAFWPAGVDLKGDLYKDKGKNQVVFVWSDLNGDTKVQPDEVKLQQGSVGGITTMADLSFCASRLNGNATRFAPTGFTLAGAPRYDLTKGEILAERVSGPGSTGGDQILTGKDGFTIATLGIKPFHGHSVSGVKDGVPTWSYPNLWPGLHASHEAAKPDQPGQLIGTTRLLGDFVSPKGTTEQLWGVNANMGNLYLFTADGLFVATLFEDVRKGKLWQMPNSERNMELKNITLHDENFWPSLTQTPDGQIYVQTGSDMAIVRVDGLDTIRRISAMPLPISADDLKKAQTYLVEAETLRQQSQGRGVLEVALRYVAKAPVVDGKLDDWKEASWVDIDKSGVGANFNADTKPYDITAAISIAGDKLYAAWKTNNSNLLQNSGEIPEAPFKTGGALDLMIATNSKANPKRSEPVVGDLRLLITQAKGKTMAVLYRAVVPGTKTPVPFSSPWRTITLDKVEDVSNQVQLAGKGGNYEISIPLSTLGLQAQAGQTIQGDIGILRGDGNQTTARTYWSNKATGITADVPSEAQLMPQLWGRVEFKATP